MTKYGEPCCQVNLLLTYPLVYQQFSVNRNRVLRMIRRNSAVMLLVGILLLGMISTAGAAENESSVSFLDDRPLSVTLAQLQGEKGLTVPLHNDFSAPQKLSLRIVGLQRSDEADVRELFPVEGVTSDHEVPPGGVGDLALPPARKDVDFTEGSFEAVLVASGSSGGAPARLPLTIELGSATTPGDNQGAVDKPEANVLRPDKVLDITLVAVNMFPSPLSSGASLILILSIAGGLLLLLLWKPLASKDEGIPKVAFSVLIVTFLASIVMFAKADSFWDQPSAHKISARPIAVSSTVAPGNVGSAASTDGELAQLVVEERAGQGKQLLPKGLDSAGTYSGSYDLTPGVEKGDAKATINIRDLWIYPLAMIILGLLIAYWLHLWFKSTRPAAKLRVSVENLEAEYEQHTEVLGKAVEATPPPLKRKFELLRQGIDDDLDDGKVDAAREKIAAMRTFLDQYRLLLVSMLDLESGAFELRKLHSSNDFGVPLEDVDPYQEAVAVLGRTGRVGEEGADELTATRKEVAEAARLVCGVVISRKSILRQLSLVEALPASGDHKESVEKIRAKLMKLGREVLEVGDSEDLKKVEAAVDTTLNEVLALEEESRSETDAPFVFVVDEPLVYGGIGTFGISGGERRILGMVSARQAPPELPRVVIAWRRRDEKKFGQPKVYKDDLVSFEITVEGADSESIEELELGFGDGQAEKVKIKGNKGIAVHRYQSGGEPTVVCASFDGVVLADESIEVDPLSKPERGKLEISERDRIAAVAAFALAVVSGMASLYLADASWGQPTDYLSALLWGGLTGEGVKAATAIADKVFPGS